MLNAALLLLCQSMFWSLHLAGGSGSFPRPLTAEEERQYLELCAKGDLDARNVLVERNLRLVAHIIKKYYTQAEEQEDLISIGTIGLIKAVNTFKADKGIRLATYASRCIENEILMYFRRTKKLQGEVSLSESIESDRDGSSLQLMDVIGMDESEAGALLALAQLGLSAESIAPAGSARHIFTHIEWDMKGYFVEVSGENDDLIWADADAFDALALPTAFKKYTALVRARLQ